MRGQRDVAAIIFATALYELQALRLPNAISSNMVLQRAPLAPRLWGFANKSELITVAFDDHSASTQPDSEGHWIVDLPVQQASTGKTISITSSSGESKTLLNVAFGDVYLCSGQSNMEFSTNDVFNASDEIADSINYPNLRFYTIKDTAADSPQFDGVSKADYQWGVSSPDSFVPAGGQGFSYFSATCYFFGRELYKALGSDVPIGLVASDWGGQRVEAFSSPDAMADVTCGGTQAPTDRPLPNPSTSQLWFGQIYPFLNMRFAGATWYQGEANAGDPESYACRFPAMIADWRQKFQLPDLSFFFVQLAAYSQDYSEIRHAQMAALKLPRTGVAVAIDLGDPSSPRGSIHPRRKQEVGRRLALACQSVHYGMDVVSSGPLFESYSVDGDQVVVNFRPDTSQTLHPSGTAACSDCCSESPLEVQLLPAQTWKWQRTEALEVNGSSIIARVQLGAGQRIAGLRFDWQGYPQCALYNGFGGPDDRSGIAASPFKPFTTLPDPVPYSPEGATVPSSDATCFEFSGGASLSGGPRDNFTSGAANLRSGGPGGVGLFKVGSPAGIVGDGHRIDAISMSFRYLAGYTPSDPTTVEASTVRLLVLDNATQKLLKALPSTEPLGNYSWDHFTGYSPPISMHYSDMDIPNDRPVALALEVTNNQRNLQIPVDDLASGFNLRLSWKVPVLVL